MTPAEGDAERVATLSPREREALIFRCKGLTIKEIAIALGIGWHTANDHLKEVHRKLDVATATEAAVIAAKTGLV